MALVCGRTVNLPWGIDYGCFVSLEDLYLAWCTDDDGFTPNPRNGVVGQEIYGAGGPIGYAVWEYEDQQE